MTELHPALAAALPEQFPDRIEFAGPEGLDELQKMFADWNGPEGIPNLADWLDRRKFQLHPARGLEPTIRFLPGRQKHGVEAAKIETVRGRDGRWYGAASFSVYTTGSYSPIGDPPFDTERQALEFYAAEVKRHVASVLDGGHYTEAGKRDARKIGEWVDEQLRGQGDLFA